MIKSMKFKIRGTRPLIMHKFNVEVLEKLERKEKTGQVGNDPTEWRKTCFITDKGELYLPGNYFTATFRNGAKYIKEGKSNLSKKVGACIQLYENKVILNRSLGKPLTEIKDEEVPRDSEKPVYVDVCGVVNPATKGRNVRYRLACSPGWECEFTVLYDDTILSLSQVKEVIKDSGTLVGIADGRGMGNGRFEIIE